MPKLKNLFGTVIVKPLLNNLSAVFFWVGLAFVFLGAMFGKSIDAWPFVPLGTGEAILKGGSAILGAGVFAVIMKSVQFTSLFQNHIYDVFYRPDVLEKGISLKEKWRILTTAILKGVLPNRDVEIAVDKIKQQFFESELEYHFESYNNTYDITIDETGKVATIMNIHETSILLSPKIADPILRQNTETEPFGGFQIKAIRLNDIDVMKEQAYKKDESNPKRNTLSIPLKGYLPSKDGGDRPIKFEKVVEWKQDLSVDPYIKVMISRYIKGATTKVKISKGFKIYFEKFGLGDMPENYYTVDDGSGHQRWVLANAGNMLLPGQGYILLIAPEQGAKNDT